MAIEGLSTLCNLSINADNKIAMRPHIGVVVSLLQVHSSNAEVIESVYENILWFAQVFWYILSYCALHGTQI